MGSRSRYVLKLWHRYREKL